MLPTLSEISMARCLAVCLAVGLELPSAKFGSWVKAALCKVWQVG